MADPVGASCRFASALSVETDIGRAVTEVCQSAMDGLQGTPDLAMLLVSSDRGPACDEIAGEVCRRLGTNRLIGCTAESILGVGRKSRELQRYRCGWLSFLVRNYRRFTWPTKQPPRAACSSAGPTRCSAVGPSTQRCCCWAIPSRFLPT